jgi:hypothetical protein
MIVLLKIPCKCINKKNDFQLTVKVDLTLKFAITGNFFLTLLLSLLMPPSASIMSQYNDSLMPCLIKAVDKAPHLNEYTNPGK